MASHDNEIYQLYLNRTIDGLPVRGSYISATINHGNLVLMTTYAWGERPPPQAARQLSAAESARAAVYDYLGALDADFAGKAEKLYVTLADASGYRYPLVWSLKGKIAGDGGNWEALVDAHSGEILSFQDTNHYAEAKGGVYPVTNDGLVPDGVEQAGSPMPFLTVTGGVTDTGGNANVTGSLASSLSGTYIRISDNCGAISLTQTNNIDYGSSAGTDCTTPGIGGAGNTHASRTGFYELNKIKEMARGQLPSNTWLSPADDRQHEHQPDLQRLLERLDGELLPFRRRLLQHRRNRQRVRPRVGPRPRRQRRQRLDRQPLGRRHRRHLQRAAPQHLVHRPALPLDRLHRLRRPCLTCTGVRDIDYLKRQSRASPTPTPGRTPTARAACTASARSTPKRCGRCGSAS